MSREPDFRIDRNGVWYYRGSVVQREAMVRLFARALRREGTGYVLETPEQLLPVEVEDAPLLVTDMEKEGEGDSARIWLVTSDGERFLLGRRHRLYLSEDRVLGELRAYVSARDGIPALVHRNVFYRMAEQAVEAGDGRADVAPGIRSDGEFFALA